jgi:hypothetical protein
MVFMKVRVFLLVVLCASLLNAQSKPEPDPAQFLARAREAMGFNRLHEKVIHTKWITALDQAYQSDRMYPPFLSLRCARTE